MKISTKMSLLALAGATMLMSGCAQKKVNIKMLEPAEVGVLANKKKIAVTKFKNDTIGLAGKIESNLAKANIDGKKYFTVVDRNQMHKILAEQKLQSSELIDPATASKIGKLIGVQAMITGEVVTATGTMGSYKKDKKECLNYTKDGQCARWHFYKVTCKTTSATVAANMHIIDVQTAAVLYGDSYNKTYNADSCKAGETNLGLLVLDTGPKQILSKNQAISKLADEIAKEFTLKLVPHYVNVNVTLLDELDLENPTESQEKRFENALKYIKQNRLKKAEKMLQKLLDEVNGESAVIAYDLGVVKEALGKLEEAKKMFQLADEKTVEPVEAINQAILRIDEEIEKRKKAQEQMSK